MDLCSLRPDIDPSKCSNSNVNKQCSWRKSQNYWRKGTTINWIFISFAAWSFGAIRKFITESSNICSIRNISLYGNCLTQRRPVIWPIYIVSSRFSDLAIRCALKFRVWTLVWQIYFKIIYSVKISSWLSIYSKSETTSSSSLHIHPAYLYWNIVGRKKYFNCYCFSLLSW